MMELEIRILLERTLDRTFRATYVDDKRHIHGVLMIETTSYNIAYLVAALDLASKVCSKEGNKSIFITNRVIYNILTKAKALDKKFLKEWYRPLSKELNEVLQCENIRFIRTNTDI